MDDPEASEYVVHRLGRSMERRKHVKLGRSKGAYVGKAREGIQYSGRLDNAINSSAHLEKKRKANDTSTGEGEVEVEKPIKRRRFSADTKIALGMSLTVWGKPKGKKAMM